MLSKSGVEISSDDGHVRFRVMSLEEWRVNHHSRVGRRQSCVRFQQGVDWFWIKRDVVAERSQETMS